MKRLTKRRVTVIALILFCSYVAVYPIVRKTFEADYSGGGKMIFLNTSFIFDTAVYFGYLPLFAFEEIVMRTRVIAQDNCRCHHPLGRFAF